MAAVVKFSPPAQQPAKDVRECSISTWKTSRLGSANGREFRKVNVGDDSTAMLLNMVFQVIRFEENGGKVILAVPTSVLEGK